MPYFLIFLLLFLSACDDGGNVEKPEEENEKPALVLSEASFSDLPDWHDETFTTFLPAFEKSCTRILKRKPDSAFGVLKEAGTYADWQDACKSYESIDKTETETIRMFFEGAFTPYHVHADDNPVGLFTGYYEASLRGSYVRKIPYIYPLHKRPHDLVMLQLGDFREDLKGIRLAGRVQNGRLKPYESRAEIVSGEWPHHQDVLLWVDNPVDAFFVQIQGSGLVRMDDGTNIRIGYDGQNGHPYYAIGRELIKRGALTKETVSMQTIRSWLEENPEHADDVMNTNASYVFFRMLDGDGPVGAEGVSLTAKRSLAIDRTLISYGIPLWVDIDHPMPETAPLRQLMIAQDTGGAIRGPVRGDVFWGYGEDAANIAGIMKSSGQYWVLLPQKQTD